MLLQHCVGSHFANKTALTPRGMTPQDLRRCAAVSGSVTLAAEVKRGNPYGLELFYVHFPWTLNQN